MEKFNDYTVPIDEERIQSWLRQFDFEHVTIFLKLLENIDYHSRRVTIHELMDLGKKIQKVTNDDFNDVFFAGFTGTGHSGDFIVSEFRLVMQLSQTKHDDKFINLSSIDDFQILENQANKRIKPYTFVFLDDYIGTGNSAIETWGLIQGSTNYTDKYKLAALVATEGGITNIKNLAPSLKIICNKKVLNIEKVCGPQNGIFTKNEKEIIKKYCERVDPKHPLGHKNTQSMTIFYRRVSNNVLSILQYKMNSSWHPLFPRF